MRRALVWVAGAALLALAGAGYYLSQLGVRVTVTNKGPAALAGVRVHVTGRTYDLGDIPSGGSRTVWVRPTGKSHVEIEYLDAEGRPVRLNAGGYFGPGYKGELEIDVKGGVIEGVRGQPLPSLLGATPPRTAGHVVGQGQVLHLEHPHEALTGLRLRLAGGRPQVKPVVATSNREPVPLQFVSEPAVVVAAVGVEGGGEQTR
jgi:hypothetical protein